MTPRVARLGVLLPWVPLVLVAACGDVLSQPIGAAAGDAGLAGDATSDDSSATRVDGAMGDGAAPDAASFCSGHGPVLPGTDLCAGDLANLFRFAACACASLDVSGVLTTDSLDSASDGGATQLASIAANQSLSTNSITTIGGSVWVGGAGVAPGSPALRLSGASASTIAHDVQAGGPIEIGGPYGVAGDVWANGNVTVDPTGSLQVGGTVHVPSGDTAAGVMAAGGIANPATVTVPAPCECSKPIPIAKIVSGFVTTNDDATINLTATALDNPAAPLALPCGLYYVDGIHGGAVTLDIQGRVALFVGGDLAVDGGIAIDLAQDAELDLFIAGNVSIKGPSGSVVIGDPGRPARTRIYVGGMGGDAGGGFALATDASISANIYAPSAVVELASSFALWGAILAQTLQFSGSFAIHYDTAVLQVSRSSGCQAPGASCTSCADCSGAAPACRSGACGPCVTTTDCCAPLTCSTGTGRCELPTQ